MDLPLTYETREIVQNLRDILVQQNEGKIANVHNVVDFHQIFRHWLLDVPFTVGYV